EAIEVTVTPLSPSTCGAEDGSAEVVATGGIAPYTYVWSNGEEETTNEKMAPGPHYVNVIDSEGCYARGFVNIESDGGPKITLSGAEHNACYGERMGSLDISISGGTGALDILWSNGASTEDVDNLAAGKYNVVVEDADGCLGAGSFEVGQPARISITPLITPSTCEGADGKAVALVSGGVEPYAYQWSSGGIFEIEEGLAAGVYSVTITDGHGCEMTSSAIVSDDGAPEVAITDVKGVGCTVIDNGSITAVASPVNPFYTYSWSSGQNTPEITGLTEGTYKITVTDEDGCKGVNEAVIMQEAPERNEICIVSVDTITGKNLILWVKDNTEDVSHYNIYRESSVKGDYQLIDSVSVNSESIYLDEVADPSIRSWRYKLSVVDVCGIESELSPHHKTMHLTMNRGISGEVNLIWDHYEGFPVSTYRIWRYDANAGWGTDPLTEIQSDLTSYTDLNPPQEDLTYFIEVLHAGGCESTDKKPTRLNSSRSNRRSSKKSASSGILGGILDGYDFNLYPNPSTGIFNVELDHAQMENVTIKVYDVTGKMLSNKEYQDIHGRFETQIDLSSYTDGMYQVQVVADKLILHRVLIKE
ncbi:T9SS type A sorting domain-containing protein, partial [Bacteroidota bacterium]